MNPSSKNNEDSSTKRRESVKKNEISCRICKSFDEMFFNLSWNEDELSLGEMLSSIVSVKVRIKNNLQNVIELLVFKG